MEEETREICEAACEGSSSCNWSNWNNPLDYQFPDGTMQTCVGAQVRCGCTLTMSLVSYITYEHPTAVVVSVLFILTLVLIMLIRYCLVEQNFTTRTTIIQKQQQGSSACTTPESIYHVSDDNETAREVNNLHDATEVSNIEKEKPPPYTYVIGHDVNCPPPSYMECMHRKN